MLLPFFARPSRAGAALPVLALLLLLLLPRPARAQIQDPGEVQDPDEVPTATRTFAIEDARIVVAPGEVIERGTVVVRDGLIMAVGEDAPVPYDAERIAGDSLTVYAGFISGLSHAGIPKQRGGDEERPDVERPGAPPNDVAGIQPQRNARAMLDPEESALGDLREAGFTAAHVVPRGEMLPGSGAVILLAGDRPGQMVLDEDASLFAQFEGAGRVYPATDMAVIATLRQLVREERRRQSLGERYTDDPQGLPRPGHDDVYDAFRPVLSGEKPLFFFTEGALDIHRALRLQEELGFPLALAGLQQSFAATGALQETDAPLFLSLALPEEPDDQPAAEADSAAADTTGPASDTLAVGQDTAKAVTPEAPGSAFIRDFRTRSYEDADDERENLLARRSLFAERYYETAATLREAGLRFGFSTMDADAGDLLGNLRTMVEHGLSEEDALAALTTNAAELLGLSRQLGTVEEGKIANLVVTGAPLFEEDAPVRYVFVDGREFEYDAGGGSGAPPEEGIEPAGTWSFEVESPQGTFGGTLTVEGTPGALSGTITGPDGEEQTLDDLELSGADLSFTFDGGQIGTLSVVATIEGDTMEGTVTVPGFGGLPLEATRTAPE